jgi:hypothetical protein
VLLGATRPAIANKRGRFDSPFLTFFVLVGVVWRRNFIRGHCPQRGRRGSFSSPFFVLFLCFWVQLGGRASLPVITNKGRAFLLFFFCFLLYLWVQLSPSSPTNRELGFPVFCFFLSFCLCSGCNLARHRQQRGRFSSPLFFSLFVFFS